MKDLSDELTGEGSTRDLQRVISLREDKKHKSQRTTLQEFHSIEEGLLREREGS